MCGYVDAISDCGSSYQIFYARVSMASPHFQFSSTASCFHVYASSTGETSHERLDLMNPRSRHVNELAILGPHERALFRVSRWGTFKLQKNDDYLLKCLRVKYIIP